MNSTDRAAEDAGNPSIVACLCAGWCRLCDAYGEVFDQVTTRLAAERPGLQARWIDIEDEAELVGDLDIQTFPTLLVCDAGGLRFAGALEPHVATLERVLRATWATGADAAERPRQPDFEALAARLWADRGRRPASAS